MMLSTVGMRVMDNGSVSMAEVVVANCSFDDHAVMVGISGFEESDSVLISIWASDVKEVVHSIDDLSSLSVDVVALISKVQGCIDLCNIGWDVQDSKVSDSSLAWNSSAKHS